MKLQEVAWTIFGDGPAGDGKERGTEDAGGEQARALRARRWQARRSCAWNEPALTLRLGAGPAFRPDVPASLSLLKPLRH